MVKLKTSSDFIFLLGEETVASGELLSVGAILAVFALNRSIYSVTLSVSHHLNLNIGSIIEAIMKQSAHSYTDSLDYMDSFRVESNLES